MNDKDKAIAFSPLQALIKSGNILKGGSIFDPNECLVVEDYEEAKRISSTQYDNEYMPWIDIRESQAAEVKGPSPTRLEFRIAWEEEIFDELEAALPEKYSDSFNDIEGDLFNCCSNIFFAKNNVFFK